MLYLYNFAAQCYTIRGGNAAREETTVILAIDLAPCKV